MGEATEGQNWGPGLGTCSSGRSRRIAAERRLQWQQWLGYMLVVPTAEGVEGTLELHRSFFVVGRSLVVYIVVVVVAAG